MNTQENNKLIAEFIKLPTEMFQPRGTMNYGMDDSWYEEHELSYHLSWEWLMPVVDKIERLGFTTSIKTNYVRINPRENAGYEHYISYITWNEDGWSSRKPHASYDDDYDMGNISYNPKEIIDKRRAMYEAVVAFINWYNKEKIESGKIKSVSARRYEDLDYTDNELGERYYVEYNLYYDTDQFEETDEPDYESFDTEEEALKQVEYVNNNNQKFIEEQDYNI